MVEAVVFMIGHRQDAEEPWPILVLIFFSFVLQLQ
jgi:hypothetical protein